MAQLLMLFINRTQLVVFNWLWLFCLSYFYYPIQKRLTTKMSYHPPLLLVCDRKKKYKRKKEQNNYWSSGQHCSQGMAPTDGISQKCRTKHWCVGCVPQPVRQLVLQKCQSTDPSSLHEFGLKLHDWLSTWGLPGATHSLRGYSILKKFFSSRINSILSTGLQFSISSVPTLNVGKLDSSRFSFLLLKLFSEPHRESHPVVLH